MSSYGWCSMEKLAGDLLLGLKFVKLEILSTSFIDFLYEELGELRLRSLGLKGLRYHSGTLRYLCDNSFSDRSWFLGFMWPWVLGLVLLQNLIKDLCSDSRMEQGLCQEEMESTWNYVHIHLFLSFSLSVDRPGLGYSVVIVTYLTS